MNLIALQGARMEIKRKIERLQIAEEVLQGLVVDEMDDSLQRVTTPSPQPSPPGRGRKPGRAVIKRGPYKKRGAKEDLPPRHGGTEPNAEKPTERKRGGQPGLVKIAIEEIVAGFGASAFGTGEVIEQLEKRIPKLTEVQRWNVSTLLRRMSEDGELKREGSGRSVEWSCRTGTASARASRSERDGPTKQEREYAKLRETITVPRDLGGGE